MPRPDKPQATIVPAPAPGDLNPGCFAPYIAAQEAAHEQVISPRNFFQVALPPRGRASSRPFARSRLAHDPKIGYRFSQKIIRKQEAKAK
jgi:hypothetical protein